ncbi:DUF2523 domain-containing protein [Pectobacterium parmentieri]|uniref:DUF2523 domain-containing protein n=2 Tax=Pectobacterium parmentieri TaxID=1905730 RepID=A0A0H3I315_PECPM|nr:DUF2523 family protein [Pectobacterium parmentieri]AFI90427.1 Phage like membrane protein [Pectobacterium parmentieri]MBI0473409.1 DUF2523 domain-containing protein [Pectobacterium parmentieri]MBI0557380.1 DUF2523 domain-containing protein [Pectobacterium parmentieri]MBI0570658.1 DUF2523 domain-containing protein [Pectobacterium parmentieri]MBI0575264.1 DUF2523 domain-containing protein [Pectobacterium parmentieri]
MLAALYTGLGFLLRSIVVKFGIMFGLFFIVQELAPVLLSLVNVSPLPLVELFSQLPDSVWYFLNIFQVPTGIAMMVSAIIARFIIRRIPIIG